MWVRHPSGEWGSCPGQPQGPPPNCRSGTLSRGPSLPFPRAGHVPSCVPVRLEAALGPSPVALARGFCTLRLEEGKDLLHTVATAVGGVTSSPGHQASYERASQLRQAHPFRSHGQPKILWDLGLPESQVGSALAGCPEAPAAIPTQPTTFCSQGRPSADARGIGAVCSPTSPQAAAAGSTAVPLRVAPRVVDAAGWAAVSVQLVQAGQASTPG